MGQVALIVAALLGVALALLLRRSSMSSGWTAITDGKDYGCKVAADGSFDFPQAPSSVHYVTKACGSLAGASGLRLRYRIGGDATFHDAQDGHEVTSGPMLYFQRSGDDWSGVGNYETYRWWAELSPGSLTPGEHEIVASFADRWSAVMTSTSIDHAPAFAAALENAARVGFTFPNDTGAGHGITASGNAHFTLLEFTVA